MSVMSAPPRKDVYLLWGSYGALSGARVSPRGRLWLLTDQHNDPESEITCRVAWNNPTTGLVDYEDLGVVSSARIRSGEKLAEVYTSAGLISLVVAPCVCGAGAVGNALPEEGRISLSYVNPYGRARLTFG